MIPSDAPSQQMPRPIRLAVEPLETAESLLDMASHFAGQVGTILLKSGGELDCARHDILALRPWLSLTGRANSMRLHVQGTEAEIDQNPFWAIRAILDHCRMPGETALPPVGSGLFGYLAYDLKDSLEQLPRTSMDDLGLPHLCLFAPRILIVHDRIENRTDLCFTLLDSDPPDTIERMREWFMDTWKSEAPASVSTPACARQLISCFDRDEYLGAVREIRELIAAGEVYQVNLSQRFEAPFSGSPYAFFRDLFRRNPAPFFAFVQAGDHQIVSTSPERFLMRRGQTLESRPIKGTRPRGKDPSADAALRAELESSPKDTAELSMIVDLVRNDFGRVCRAGSVRVASHKRVEAYRNVFHLVSTVEGRLDSGRDSVDAITALFPGGSITGCPKIRSMEIIDALEPLRRHIYTGSIGYIGFQDTMDLSIAIRTAVISGGRIVFSAGGGIVYDSDPAKEYDETLHKGETLMAACQHAADSARKRGSVVWLNGMLRPADEASIPLADLGVQYGYGFFETIRAENGMPLLLDRHIYRFNHTWRTLFAVPPPDLTWGDIIGQALHANGLSERVAAIKILATHGPAGGNRPALAVTARPYIHRLAGRGEGGIRLVTWAEPRQSPLAAHKTLNYLYYYLAGQWALSQLADEALILNPDGSVSETNTANLLLVRGKTILRPESPHVLGGVMEGAACAMLQEAGFEVVSRRLEPGDLLDGDGLLLTNSLMGAVPVDSLDGQGIPSANELAQLINRRCMSPPHPPDPRAHRKNFPSAIT